MIVSPQVLLAAAYLDDARTGRHMEFEPSLSSVSELSKAQSGDSLVTIMIRCGDTTPTRAGGSRGRCTSLWSPSWPSPSSSSRQSPVWRHSPRRDSGQRCESVSYQGSEFYLVLLFQILIEIFCLGFFLFRLAHEYLFSQRKVFWRDAKHLMVLTILTLTVIDICIFTGLAETGIQSVRWSRPLRPLLIVNIPEGTDLFQHQNKNESDIWFSRRSPDTKSIS